MGLAHPNGADEQQAGFFQGKLLDELHRFQLGHGERFMEAGPGFKAHQSAVFIARRNTRGLQQPLGTRISAAATAGGPLNGAAGNFNESPARASANGALLHGFRGRRGSHQHLLLKNTINVRFENRLSDGCGLLLHRIFTDTCIIRGHCEASGGWVDMCDEIWFHNTTPTHGG